MELKKDLLRPLETRRSGQMPISDAERGPRERLLQQCRILFGIELRCIELQNRYDQLRVGNKPYSLQRGNGLKASLDLDDLTMNRRWKLKPNK